MQTVSYSPCSPLLALVCTLSLAIASLGWFPAQSLAQENQSLAQENQTGSNRSGELQQMADDLAFQLNLLGQFDRPAFQARALELEKALQAWNDATRTDADFTVMEAWLRKAIRSSLPGGIGPGGTGPSGPSRLSPMPAQPNFLSPRAPIASSVALPPQAIPQPTATAEHAAVPPTLASPTTSGVLEPASTNSTVPPVVRSPVATEPAGPRIAAAPSTPAALWRQHPATRPIELGNPFMDDQPPFVGNQPKVATHVTMRPTTARPTTGQTVSYEQETAEVNLGELKARVRGFSHGLRGVEAKLASPKLSTTELLLAARELHQLASQREFLSLYLQAEKVQLPSLDDAKAMMQEHLEAIKSPPSHRKADPLFDPLFAEEAATEASTLETNNAGQDGAIELIEELLGQL